MDLGFLEKHPVRDILSRRKGLPYVTEKELAVLEHGRPFEPGVRPKGFRLRKRKECFLNAGDYAIRDPKFGTYVEGFAASNDMPPFHHAWLTLNGESAIDVTLRDTKGFYFFGIEFPTALLLKWVGDRRCWGLLEPFDGALIEDLRAYKEPCRRG